MEVTVEALEATVEALEATQQALEATQQDLAFGMVGAYRICLNISKTMPKLSICSVRLTKRGKEKLF